MSTFTKIEALISAMIGSVMAILLILGPSFAFADAIKGGALWEKIVWGTFLVWCLVTELWFFCTTWIVILRQLSPFALAVAALQPTVPWLLRFPLALWWSFQLCMGMAWALVMTVAEKQLPVAASLVLALFTSAISYLTFGYCLLAVTTFTKRPEVLARVWGWRTKWAIVQGLFVIVAKFFVAPNVNLA